MNIPVPQDRLDAWARFAECVRGEAWRLHGELGPAGAGDLDQARADLLSLCDRAADSVCDLERAGAVPPAGLQPIPEVPLHLLDTERSSRLLRVLEDAVEAAQRVDQERGNWSPDDPTSGPLASELAEILARVSIEVRGPAGRGEGVER